MSEYKLNPPTVSSYTENMMLKVLFEHKGFSEVFRETSWRSDEIASAFGLPEELENDKNLRTVARRLLKERYKNSKNPPHFYLSYGNRRMKIWQRWQNFCN